MPARKPLILGPNGHAAEIVDSDDLEVGSVNGLTVADSLGVFLQDAAEENQIYSGGEFLTTQAISIRGTNSATIHVDGAAVAGPDSTPQCARLGIGVPASGAASALLVVGGNPVTFTSANYVSCVDATNGGRFIAAKDGSNYGYLQFHSSGYSHFSTVEAGTSFVNSFVISGGCLMMGVTTKPSGATRNLVLGGGSTSPVLGAATADIVSLAAVDNGAGNRELQVQTEAGGILAYGSDTLRRVPTANRDVVDRIKAVTTTDATVTTVDTIAIAAGYTYLIETCVVARRTGGTAGTADDGASYIVRGTYTTKSGVVTVMGGLNSSTAEDQAAWDATLTISGTNVLVRVTGAANNNVSWQAHTTVERIAS